MAWTTRDGIRLRSRPHLDPLVPYSSAMASAVPITVRASSNEAPNGVSPAVLEAVTTRMATINRYPQLGMGDLAATIADWIGAGHDEVVAADGSLSVLNYLLLAFCTPGSTVVYSWRSYEAYPICVRTSGAEPVEVPNTADGGHDLDAMLAAVDDRTAAVLLCTPNNPTGAMLTHEAVRRFVEQVPATVLVIVDEAYLDFVTDEACVRTAELMTDHSNVVSLRTFSKAWGLAGIRVGYLVAAPEVCLALRKILPPFSTNALAEAAVPAALSEPEFHDAIVDAVLAQRDAVVELLTGHGLPVVPSQANFVWSPLGEGAVRLGAACAERGMSTRVFAGEGIRISLGEPGLVPVLAEALDAFARTLV